MFQHKFKKTTLALSITTAIFSNVIMAASDKENIEEKPKARLFEVIEVKAQKRIQNINSIGVTVNAFSEEQLEGLGIAEATDVLNFTPGATMTETGVTGVPVYTIRGIGFDDYATNSSSTVGLNVDEVAIPYPTMTRGPQFDIANVEILKGPQGTLYGLNTTGGAINFYTNDAIESFEAGIKVKVDSDSVFSTDGFVTGNIAKGLDGRFAYYIAKGNEGWQNNAAVNGAGQTNGETDKEAFRIKLNWYVNDNLDAALKVNYYQDKSDNIVPQHTRIDSVTPKTDANSLAIKAYVTEQITLAGLPDVNDPNSAAWNPEKNNTRDNKGLDASLKLNYYGDDITFTSITAVNYFERDENNEWDGVAISNFEQNNISDISAFSQELRLTSEWDNGFNWIMGLYYANDIVKDSALGSLEASSASIFALPAWLGVNLLSEVQAAGYAFNELNSQYKQESETKAIFLHTEYDVTDDVQLTVGLRYTRDEREIIDSCTYDVNGTLAGFFSTNITGATYQPGGCVTVNPQNFVSGTFNKTISSNNTSGKIGLNWVATEDVFVYGSVSTGYKSGGFGASNAATWDSLESYDNEEVISYELGLKSSWFDRKIQFNSAIFRYDYDDKQVSALVLDPVFGTLSKILNAPKAEVNGAEVEINWYPTDNTLFRLSSAYLDTQYIEFESLTFGSAVVKDLSGQRLQNTPKWQHNLMAHKDIEINSSMFMFVGGDISYSSEYNAVVGNDPRFAIDSYSQLNLRGGIASTDETWRVSVWVENAFDKEYSTSRISSSDSTTDILARERRFGLTFSYNWSE